MNTTPPAPTLRRRVRAAGLAVWQGPAGDWLRERGEELSGAADNPATARVWIKATTAVCAGIALLGAAAWALGAYVGLTRTVTTAAGSTPVGRHWGDLVAVTTHPVRSYITAHAAALPVSASVLYAAWQLLAVVLLVAAWRRSSGARVGWVLLGGATGAMVWAGTPASGQALAAGEFALMWALASLVALRGLSLRPSNHVYVDARTTARP